MKGGQRPPLSPEDRRRLRRILLEVEPWLTATEVGPQAVDAGSCDRCGRLPRLLPTCGPTRWEALCRPCGQQIGTDAWCDGHVEAGRQALAWAETLPPHWDVVATLWWVATGEVALERLVVERIEALDDRVRALLAP